MSEELPPCPRGHTGDGYRVRLDGFAVTAQGRKQLLLCVAADGTSHRYRVKTVTLAATDRRRKITDVRCPKPGHRDSIVESRGLRTGRTGTWRRFSCTRPNGDSHWFRVMVSEDGATTPVVVPAPPSCTEHPGSKVVRAGTYGVRSRRQRYLCRPEDGKPHQFTPPLSREAVSPGEACQRCDELLSPHHGPLTAARHTPWPLVGLAQALNDLSLGESYADVSLALRARRDEASEHLAHAHGVTAFSRSSSSPATTTVSYSRTQRRNAWRVAADMVEQYSPPLFADVDRQYRAEAQAMRSANDAALAGDPTTAFQQPLVYVLDDLSLWAPSPNGRAQRPTWHVLTAVEVRWKDLGDPFSPLQRDSRLRLARAFPRVNSDAWQLVLDELAVRPDFVVADRGSGLDAAIKNYYGAPVGVVPSLWHIHSNLRDALLKLHNTTYLDGKEKVLVDPLRKHLSQLARDDLIGSTKTDIAQWWDKLEAIVAGLPAPVVTIANMRAIHEPRLVDALPILTANPHVPASNAAVENRIRNDLKPFLENRAHLFGNQERTNRLLNLLVCRQAGVFTNLDTLALRIRDMNEASGGWAPAPRQILDKQPPSTGTHTKRYQSLKSRSVIAKLAKEKGITTTAQARAQAISPPPAVSKQRPLTVELSPIREWARNLGMPGNVTGPLRASVKAAYEAARNGATDEEAKKVYEEAEAERHRVNEATKRALWRGARERERKAELAPIREWAREHGYAVAVHGTISKAVIDAYNEAQQGKTSTKRPSARPKKAKP